MFRFLVKVLEGLNLCNLFMDFGNILADFINTTFG